MRRPSSSTRPALALVLAGLTACGGESGGVLPTIETFVTAVTATGAGAAERVCAPFPGEGAGPPASADDPPLVIPGGSAYYTLSSDGSFDEIVVGVQGADCYWRLAVPPASARVALLTIAQGAPRSFSLVFALGSGGVRGTHEVIGVTLTDVVAGKVQVSVTWDAPSDVDLHLVEPGGEEIFYDNERSAAGGVLDLDSNSNCTIDGRNAENIGYGAVDPPRGTYTVRLDYYASCGVAATSYVVTVNVEGVTQTFGGTFTGPGEGGGAGDGVPITTFTY